MSRSIKTTFHIDKEERMMRDTSSGKLLFTQLLGRKCAMYLRGDRLIAAQVLSEASNRIGAVFIGKVKKTVKNIDACFVEISDGEICFLSMRDAAYPFLLNRTFDGRILEGDEILVQFSKEAQKNKQASVTACLSLTNDYAVVSMGSSHIGYSNKLDGQKRAEIAQWLSEAGLQENNHLKKDIFPVTTGLIVRTEAEDCERETLLDSIEELLFDMNTLFDTARHRTCFCCVREAPEAFEAVLDQMVYSYEYREILTDDALLYEKLCEYAARRLPDKQIRFYEDCALSLSKLYSLETKLDTALNKRVWLKSGGYLVIEPTEALTVIDVNTGKYEAKKPSWEVYESINREAAQEIAAQLRLRNLSGMVLVDFISMKSKESEESLLEFLKALVRRDKLKTNVVDITPLGLVEITRKKRNKPLREQFGGVNCS